jgi:hypothetical protein
MRRIQFALGYASFRPIGEMLRDQADRRELEQLIRSNQRFWSILAAARSCDPPDWFIGAGVIRNLVWDSLHSFVEPTPCADVDVAFFEPRDLSPERDRAVQAQLSASRPDVPWEATNQAAVHLWYERVFGYAVPPLASSADAIGTWPETATCVGVRLLPNDELLIVAPYGLSDLFNLILRRNPRRVSRAEFRRRIREKKIQDKWPRVRIVDDETTDHAGCQLIKTDN